MADIQATFHVGDKVKAVAFVNCFGKQVPETTGLTVESIQFIGPESLIYPGKPYYRLMARAADGFGYIEGNESHFAAE